MKAQRLKQIEEVFLAVIEIPLVERESFFKKNYTADEDLRREVESLLAFEETSTSFLDKQPEALAAEMFVEEERKSSLLDKQIGYYKIKKLLGKGWMGEVYLAEDVRLNRQVALKFPDNENSYLNAEQKIQVPENDWFELGAKEGTEFVWLVWSPNIIAEIESAKRFANSIDRGRIKNAKLSHYIQLLLRKYQSGRKNVTRDDDKKCRR